MDAISAKNPLQQHRSQIALANNNDHTQHLSPLTTFSFQMRACVHNYRAHSTLLPQQHLYDGQHCNRNVADDFVSARARSRVQCVVRAHSVRLYAVPVGARH